MRRIRPILCLMTLVAVACRNDSPNPSSQFRTVRYTYDIATFDEGKPGQHALLSMVCRLPEGEKGECELVNFPDNCNTGECVFKPWFKWFGLGFVVKNAEVLITPPEGAVSHQIRDASREVQSVGNVVFYEGDIIVNFPEPQS